MQGNEIHVGFSLAVALAMALSANKVARILCTQSLVYLPAAFFGPLANCNLSMWIFKQFRRQQNMPQQIIIPTFPTSQRSVSRLQGAQPEFVCIGYMLRAQLSHVVMQFGVPFPVCSCGFICSLAASCCGNASYGVSASTPQCESFLDSCYPNMGSSEEPLIALLIVRGMRVTFSYDVRKRQLDPKDTKVRGLPSCFVVPPYALSLGGSTPQFLFF